jgi:hypothetical protein
MNEEMLQWEHNDEEMSLVCVLRDYKATIKAHYNPETERDGFIARIRTPMGEVDRKVHSDLFRLLDWSEAKLISLGE